MTFDQFFRLTLAPIAMISRAWTVAVNRRKTAELFEYSDSQLRDIGLTRQDIQLAMRGGPWSDPTPHLNHYAAVKKPIIASAPVSPVTVENAAKTPAKPPVLSVRAQSLPGHKAAA